MPFTGACLAIISSKSFSLGWIVFNATGTGLLSSSTCHCQLLRNMELKWPSLANFPGWRDLNRFTELLKIREFSDGRKYEDLSKVKHPSI
jgi:hypothetical protein